MTNREGLNKLMELSNQLDQVDYSDIIDLLKNTIRKIPIPLAKLRANSDIDRARPNIGENLFTSVDELTYIKKQDVIEKYLTGFGRANKPYQPMFYGAIETTVGKPQRMTAIAEVSKLYQNPVGVNLNGELHTVSRWKNKEELIIVEVVFAAEAIKINPDIRKAFEKQTEFAKQAGQDDLEFYTDFLIFISEQFAREVHTHHDYKISTAYTDLILTKPEIQGISFPSVQTEYVGVNVVFEPKVIDKYFDLKVLATQRFYKNILKRILNNHKNCVNPNECYDNIIWSDLEAKYLMPDNYIQHYLAS